MTDIPIADWVTETYIVGRNQIPYDEVLGRIERYSIELQVDTAPVARGSIEAFNLMEVLREALTTRAEKTGDTVMSDLCPQLLGLEGHVVKVTDMYGDTRQVRVERTEPKYGIPPRHVEVRLGSRVLAHNEYESVEVVK